MQEEVLTREEKIEIAFVTICVGTFFFDLLLLLTLLVQLVKESLHG